MILPETASVTVHLKTALLDEVGAPEPKKYVELLVGVAMEIFVAPET